MLIEDSISCGQIVFVRYFRKKNQFKQCLLLCVVRKVDARFSARVCRASKFEFRATKNELGFEFRILNLFSVMMCNLKMGNKR